MPSISYQINLGGTNETITVGAAAPTSGDVELRFQQNNTVTDAANPGGGLRPLKRGEVYVLLQLLEGFLSRDPNVVQ